MSEDRFKDVFHRLVSRAPDPPSFSELETHKAAAKAPIRFKPWMAAAGAALVVLLIVGVVGALGGGGPDLAQPDDATTVQYLKVEYSSQLNPVCEGGTIVDNGGFEEATIEIWGPNADGKTLLVSSFPDGSTERTIVEGTVGNPDTIWVTGDPEEYPASTKFRVVECEGITGSPPVLFDAFTSGGPGGFPSQFLEPPPGFETWGEAMNPLQEPVLTEWNGTSALLYEIRTDLDAGFSALDLYVTEDGQKVLRLHAEQVYDGVGEATVTYSVVDADHVPAGSVSFDTARLTALSQVVAEPGPDDCPVTIPSQGFTPPDGYPATPSDPDAVWFGKDELWTALSTDGTSDPRKSFWWSVNFPGGGVEPEPELEVRYTLLNSLRSLTLESTAATNAHTEADGWFIIAGLDTRYAGCWEVTAIYKNASLTYVYYNPDGADPEPVVPDVVGMTVERAGNVLHDAGYEASFHDSATPTYEVCAQEPGAGLEISPGEIIGMRTAPPGECSALMDPTATGERCLDYFPPQEDFVVLVFFNCGVGEHPNLRPVGRGPAQGTAPDASIFPITYAMNHLLAGPTATERADGFGSFFSEESASALLTGNFQDGHLILDFTEDIAVNNASTATGSTFFLAELYANAFQFEQVGSVEFRINGSCEAFWEFLQAGPTCNVLNRAGWEQMQSQWGGG